MKVADLASEMYKIYLIDNEFKVYNDEQIMSVLNFVREHIHFFNKVGNSIIACGLTGFEWHLVAMLCQRGRNIKVKEHSDR